MQLLMMSTGRSAGLNNILYISYYHGYSKSSVKCVLEAKVYFSFRGRPDGPHVVQGEIHRRSLPPTSYLCGFFHYISKMLHTVFSFPFHVVLFSMTSHLGQ